MTLASFGFAVRINGCSEVRKGWCSSQLRRGTYESFSFGSPRALKSIEFRR
jgi:hypothetical protein